MILGGQHGGTNRYKKQLQHNKQNVEMNILNTKIKMQLIIKGLNTKRRRNRIKGPRRK